MSADKSPSIFSRQMEDIVYIFISKMTHRVHVNVPCTPFIAKVLLGKKVGDCVRSMAEISFPWKVTKSGST